MKKASDLRIPFTWAERRTVLLEKALYVPGYFDRHGEWGKIDWASPSYFGNEHPVAIEFCCGNGQWIGIQAKERPGWNWIAVDRLFERARKAWAKIFREEIGNLFVVCAEAIAFVRHYVSDSSVDEVFVNFPDPWPKLKHAKNRLIRKEFLDELARIVKKGGKGHFVTDDFPYLTQMVEEIQKNSSWQFTTPSPYYTTDWPYAGPSYFGDLWRTKGRTIYYLQVQNG